MKSRDKKGDDGELKRKKEFQTSIANNVTDIITGESAVASEGMGRLSLFGLGLVLLAIAYFVTSDTFDTQAEIVITIALVYLYQCIMVSVGAISRIAQKSASILAILAMFTVTYEESGLNVMKAFFDGVSAAAESDKVKDDKEKTDD